MRSGQSILALLAFSRLSLSATIPAADQSTQLSFSDGEIGESSSSSSGMGGVEEGEGIERYDESSVWRIDWSMLDDSVKGDVMGFIESMNLDIWHTSHSTLDVRLSSHQLSILRGYMPLSSFAPFIPNLQNLIDDTYRPYDDERESDDESESQTQMMTLKKKKGGKKGKKGGKKEKIDPFNLTTIQTPFHDSYHPLSDLYRFGDTLINTFDGLSLDLSNDGQSEGETETEVVQVNTFTVGTTFEGRDIRGWSAKVVKRVNGSVSAVRQDQGENTSGSGSGNVEEVEPELEFIVQSGQHAREWVGPSSALYFLHSLLLSATNDPSSEAALLLRSFTFTVIPTINPDGLEYSRDHSRLWRKNRQAIDSKSCLGIDLNSNWGYKWRPSKSATPCSEAYPGKAAFEAYESKAVSEYLSTAAERGSKIRAFVDMHSYGQLCSMLTKRPLVMFPFAHSCEDFPPDAEMLMEAGLGVAKAMRSRRGEGYEAGQACDLTYRAPGDAIDYSYGITDVRWSYSAELRDTGTYGFLLPPKLIRVTAEEASAGLHYLAKFIYTLEVAQ